MNDKKNDLTTRREFFKKAAKATLPIIGITAIASVPGAMQAAETGCLFGCSGSCSAHCAGDCYNGCKDQCKDGCKGRCTNGCFGSCVSMEAFIGGTGHD